MPYATIAMIVMMIIVSDNDDVEDKIITDEYNQNNDYLRMLNSN